MVQARKAFVWEKGELVLPHNAIPSSFGNHIEVHYKKKLTNSANCSISVPILIGNIPIERMVNNQTPVLPSYEECIVGNSYPST